MKLLVIGFDGLEPNNFYHYDWNDLNIMPLWSLVASTGPSWSSALTGVKVEKHGVTNVAGLPRDGSKTLATCDYDPIFSILSKSGIKVGCYNVPMTYPIVDKWDINGFMVAGYPILGNAKMVHNAELIDNYKFICDMVQWDFGEFNDGWGNYVLDLGWQDSLKRNDIDSGMMSIDFYTECQRQKPDFGFIQFSFIDRMGHMFGWDLTRREMEKECYELVSRLIKDLMDMIIPKNLMVISDHGFAGNTHTNAGTLALKGEMFPETGIDTIHTHDISAQILKVFGLDVPDYFDGTVKEKLFK